MESSARLPTPEVRYAMRRRLHEASLLRPDTRCDGRLDGVNPGRRRTATGRPAIRIGFGMYEALLLADRRRQERRSRRLGLSATEATVSGREEVQGLGTTALGAAEISDCQGMLWMGTTVGHDCLLLLREVLRALCDWH